MASLPAFLAQLPLWRQAGWTPPSPARNYLVAVLGLVACEQLFEAWLAARQRRRLRAERLPEALEREVAAVDRAAAVAPAPQSMARDARAEDSSLLAQLRRKLHDSQAYNLHKSSFALASMGYSFLTGGALMCCGFTAWAWDQSRVAAGQLGLGGSEVAVGSVFLAATSVVGLAINLPLSLYKVFWLEAKFGFNKTTPGTFAVDLLKGFVVEMALTLPLMAAIVKLVHFGGELFWRAFIAPACACEAVVVAVAVAVSSTVADPPLTYTQSTPGRCSVRFLS
jgi:hypothetical protein